MTGEPTFNNLVRKVAGAKELRQGVIAFTLSGAFGGNYYLDCTRDSVNLVEGAPPTPPLIEIIGDAQKVLAVLDGRKDARTQFFAGDFRLRGDLRYAGGLAAELGYIEEPF